MHIPDGFLSAPVAGATWVAGAGALAVALHAVTLAVAAAGRVALLGPNGAGRYTLLLHLAGLLPGRRCCLHQNAAADAAHHPIAVSGAIRLGGMV